MTDPIDAILRDVEASATIGMDSGHERVLADEIRSLRRQLVDAKNYAAEIAQGVSHYPHGEEEPCVRCAKEKAEADAAALRAALNEIVRVEAGWALTVEIAKKALSGESAKKGDE